MTVWAEDDGTRRVVTLAEFDGADGDEARPPERRPAASDAAVLDLVRDWLETGGATRPNLRVVEGFPANQ